MVDRTVELWDCQKVARRVGKRADLWDSKWADMMAVLKVASKAAQ